MDSSKYFVKSKYKNLKMIIPNIRNMNFVCVKVGIKSIKWENP